MKKTLLIILAIVVCAVAGAAYVGHSVYRAITDVIASGCVNGCVQINNGGPLVKGSGILKTESRTVAPFTAIRLDAPADLVIDRTGTQSLSLSVDDNLLGLFTSEVKDGTLYLGVAKDKSFQAKSAVFHATVTALRNAIYFHAYQHTRSLAVLSAWAVAAFAAMALASHFRGVEPIDEGRA